MIKRKTGYDFFVDLKVLLEEKIPYITITDQYILNI